MNQGALANFILGGVIALLPLYIRIGFVDFARTSKDNLLLVILMALMVILPGKVRRLPSSLWFFFIYASFSLVLNQYNVISVLVMMQSFYVMAGVCFFVAYYERHCNKSLNYIIDGMALGCVIQIILGIGNIGGINLHEMVIMLFRPEVVYVPLSGHGQIVGSLGNTDLFGSYVAITSMALLSKDRIILFIIALVVMLKAGTMMGIGSMVIGALYYLNAKKSYLSKLWVYILASVAMVTVFFTGLGGLDSQRFGAWRTMFSWVDINHFIFGKGPGWFAGQNLKLHDGADSFGIMAQEHSGFISAFNVFGMLGIMLCMSTVYTFLKKKDGNLIFASALFAAFCSSFGHFTLHQSTVAIIIIVLACICMAEGNKDEFNL